MFTHAANPANALEPGTQEDIRFTAQYVKVWSYEEEMEDGRGDWRDIEMISISGHSRFRQG